MESVDFGDKKSATVSDQTSNNSKKSHDSQGSDFLLQEDMCMVGRVLRAQSGFFRVQTEVGILDCKLRGKLKKERQQTDIAVIGDNVEVTQIAPHEGVIESVLERQSCFSRKQPGPRGQWKEDVLIANLDQIVVVFACASPPMNPRLLDRFLVVAEYNHIHAIIVANKVDLVKKEEAQRLFGLYEEIGYPVMYISTRTGEGINHLRTHLAQRISVFVGPSGVGKSSVLNALQPGLQLRTSEVSVAMGKGRHTTIVAELHELHDSNGGYVADTPGIRELSAWRIPDDELAWCFPEMRPLLGACGFRDCTHIHEPDCALLHGVEIGLIHPERHESYVRQIMKQER